jgi:type II secretory ATPase GspE/PulE/Tfp pilus assembly ATPase PilB-like protein
VLEHASSVTIEHLAVEQGMDTLRISALRRVAKGEFTVEEMLRVIS